MSQRLIARSPDLKRLQDDGYDVHTKGAAVIIRGVPYLAAEREVKFGTLISTLVLADDVTVNPLDDHVAFFAGDLPHTANGRPVSCVINENFEGSYGGVDVNIQMSAKPKTADPRYRDYHHKMTTYLRILAGPAKTVGRGTDARSFPVVVEDEEPTVFQYVDSAASRSGLDEISRKLEVGAVAIVGLGGTGSYILDMLAKTPIRQLHLYDGDSFDQHNAFRAPGAPTNAEVAERPKKVARFGDLYSAMHRGIIQHPYSIDEATIDELRVMDFVFIAIDSGAARKRIIESLEAFGVGFIDAGLGVRQKDGHLSGLVRTTTSTPQSRGAKSKIPFSGGDQDNDYSQNIQVADLNALNAVLAVIKWKKTVGFYGDVEHEYHSLYTVNGNFLINVGGQ